MGRADVSFYGLFIDEELLRAKGLKLRAVAQKVGLPADYVVTLA